MSDKTPPPPPPSREPASPPTRPARQPGRPAGPSTPPPPSGPKTTPETAVASLPCATEASGATASSTAVTGALAAAAPATRGAGAAVSPLIVLPGLFLPRGATVRCLARQDPKHAVDVRLAGSGCEGPLLRQATARSHRPRVGADVTGRQVPAAPVDHRPAGAVWFPRTGPGRATSWRTGEEGPRSATTELRSYRWTAVVATAVVVVVCALLVASRPAIWPVALVSVWALQGLAATPRSLWPRGAR